MMIRIPLQVEGVDLSSDEVLESMDPDLDELDWIMQGPLTFAVVYSEESSQRAAVAEAHDWVLRIHKSSGGATVTRVFDELVGWNEIAARCTVTPEAVRTWAKGLRRGQAHPFPAPRQAVPLGASRRSLHLYAWREVLTWVRQVIGLDPDEDMNYLDDSSIAELDAYIAGERSATQPRDYTPLPSRVLPECGQIEAKLYSKHTWVRLLEVAEAPPHWDRLDVGPILLHLSNAPQEPATWDADTSIFDADLPWWVGHRSSLA